MDDSERYLFDLQGFVTVASALSDGAAPRAQPRVRCARGGQRRAGCQHAPVQQPAGLGEAVPRPHRQPAGDAVLEAILGAHFRLDHEYGDLIRRGKGPIGTRLHGAATPFDPAQYYLVADGQMRSGLCVVAYNLRDVGPGDGGFAAVPGSHKANYRFPQEWIELGVPEPRPFVRAVTGPAGTAVIFTEALTHGTLPWRGAGERRTLFFKYSPHASSWSASYYDADRWPT